MNAARFIMLPAVSERSPVRLGRYVAFVLAAKRSPAAEFKHGLDCWWPVTGAEIVKQFRSAMHERISQAIPYSARGVQ